MAAPTVTPLDARAAAITAAMDAQRAANAGRRLRPCPGCGTPTAGRRCSTACHRADEPGAYESELP